MVYVAMKNKVCHITSAHSRYDVRILIKQCRSLAAGGYNVTLLVNDNKPDEIMDGVKIVSTGFVPKNRLDRFINARKKIERLAVQIDADIYQMHDPDLLVVGNRLKRRNKRVIFDSHEDVPQQIMDKYWIPAFIRKAVSMIYSKYEKKYVSKFDAVISVTPQIVDRFKYINKNSVMITNYPIADENTAIRRNPGRAVCFAGGVSEQWSHLNILKALDGIEDIKYLLAGNGEDSYLERLRSLPGWNKVEYFGKVPYSEVKSIYSRSFAGVALNKSSQAKGQGTLGNTKLFEFMEAALPVICTNYTLWSEIIYHYKCGICVDPSSVEDIRRAIRQLLDNPGEARAMGENGRKAVLEKYNWGSQEKVLLELYTRLSL